MTNPKGKHYWRWSRCLDSELLNGAWVTQVERWRKTNLLQKKNLAIRLGLLSSEDFQVEAVDSTGSGGG